MSIARGPYPSYESPRYSPDGEPLNEAARQGYGSGGTLAPDRYIPMSDRGLEALDDEGAVKEIERAARADLAAQREAGQ